MDSDLPMANWGDSNVLEDFERPSGNQQDVARPPVIVADECPEDELPGIMGSLEIAEDASSTLRFCNVDSVVVRRSQRKRSIPRVATGGIIKRRCSLRPQSIMDRGGTDSPFQESEDKIREFYKNYNKSYKKPPSRSLETIYEEPVNKNGTVVLSGPRRKRFLSWSTQAKRKKRQLKIKSMLLNKTYDKTKKHFTIEEVKNHLAESGIFM